MRHSSRRFYALLPAVLLLTSCAAKDSAQCTLRVAWDPYEPYSYSDGGELPVGYDIEVVTKVAQMTDCSLVFTKMEWGDVLAALEAGEADITVGTGYKPDRAKWSWYSESYRKEVIALMVRMGSAQEFKGSGLEEIFERGFVFGKTTDDTYDDSLEAVFTRFADQVQPRVNEEQNMHRLLDEEIDGFLVEVNVGYAIARRLNVTDAVEYHPISFDAGAYRLQISKRTISAQRLAAINAAIQELEFSGWLGDRLTDYGLPRADGTR